VVLLRRFLGPRRTRARALAAPTARRDPCSSRRRLADCRARHPSPGEAHGGRPPKSPPPNTRSQPPTSRGFRRTFGWVVRWAARRATDGAAAKGARCGPRARHPHPRPGFSVFPGGCNAGIGPCHFSDLAPRRSRRRTPVELRAHVGFCKASGPFAAQSNKTPVRCRAYFATGIPVRTRASVYPRRAPGTAADG